MSASGAELLRLSLPWMDGLWDEGMGLLHNPDRGRGIYGDQTTRHLVRETTWYALGLFMRGKAGDHARALRALERVLEHQYREPGTVYHGSFARSPEEPQPGTEAVIWRDYDPNWRQFIGTAFALALERCGNALPEELASRLADAILEAVRGEPVGRVVPEYSNIALMKSWLEVYVGRRFAQPELVASGERLAQEVHALFRRHGAFSEYNSPTYYGVVLYALALWREVRVSELLALLGMEMEGALWHDVARLYHPGLGNLCGPFDRAYGMDMKGYAASLGLWLWAALGQSQAPFPDMNRPFAHAADLCLAPCVALLGARLPEELAERFVRFGGERYLEQTISDAPRRVATAWLHERLMLGGQVSSGAMMIPRQFHPATAHWRAPDGGVAWFRLVYQGGRAADAVARPYALELTPPIVHADLVFEVAARRPKDIRAERWALPGLNVRVEGDWEGFGARPNGTHLELAYQGAGAMRLRLEPAGTS